MKFALKHGRPGNCCQVCAKHATSILEETNNYFIVYTYSIISGQRQDGSYS